MIPDALKELMDKPYSLTPRPYPVSGDLRSVWRMATCLLIIGSVRGRRASLEQVHFLGHAIRREMNRNAALKALVNSNGRDVFAVRVDPTLSQALDMAIGTGLVRTEGRRYYELTSEGQALLKVIQGERTLLDREKRFLQTAGSKANKKRLVQILNFGV